MTEEDDLDLTPEVPEQNINDIYRAVLQAMHVDPDLQSFKEVFLAELRLNEVVMAIHAAKQMGVTLSPKWFGEKMAALVEGLMTMAPEAPARDERICQICDGGPGNDGACLCGAHAYEASPPACEEAPAEGAGEVALRTALEAELEWHERIADFAFDAAREASERGEKADEADAMRRMNAHQERVSLIHKALRARSSAPEAREGDQPKLTVWYGEMPESNGRRNWTATIRRVNPTDKWDQGFCFARSEYPDRVRYEADRMRWIIGELAERPNILAYDADLHSGYVAPAAPSADKLPKPSAVMSFREGEAWSVQAWYATREEADRVHAFLDRKHD